MSRQGKVEAYEYVADTDLAANGGLQEGPKTKINIENLAAGAVPDASTTVKGKVELATVAEAEAGTDTTRAVTPEGLAAAIAAADGGVLEYVATVTQSGTNNPVVTELKNTLGTTLTWTRQDVGLYRIEASVPLFVAGRTAIFPGVTGSGVVIITAIRSTDYRLSLSTTNASNTPIDGAMGGTAGTAIRIQVYPAP